MRPGPRGGNRCRFRRYQAVQADRRRSPCSSHHSAPSVSPSAVTEGTGGSRARAVSRIDSSSRSVGTPAVALAGASDAPTTATPADAVAAAPAAEQSPSCAVSSRAAAATAITGRNTFLGDHGGITAAGTVATTTTAAAATIVGRRRRRRRRPPRFPRARTLMVRARRKQQLFPRNARVAVHAAVALLFSCPVLSRAVLVSVAIQRDAMRCTKIVPVMTVVAIVDDVCCCGE
mmetsp:Transcript_7382/g.18042  ORF Transcript_7382/g.18042 Transcript_7382/m.18042 type:complete len:232 (+) Transcript_7382:950-1645(+)